MGVVIPCWRRSRNWTYSLFPFYVVGEGDTKVGDFFSLLKDPAGHSIKM